MSTYTSGQQTLIEFATGLGGQDVGFDGEGVAFRLGSSQLLAFIKAGASRIRGHVVLDRLDVAGFSEAYTWSKRQPPPQSGALECVAFSHGPGELILSLVFERPLVGPWPGLGAVLEEAEEYGRGWQERSDVPEPSRPTLHDMSGDPRDLSPVNAWLLKGKRSSYPTDSDLRTDAQEGNSGVFNSLWTVAKQTEVGDLALVYFLAPDSAVHFVARAASRAFFDRETIPDEGVSSAQWWAYLTPFIQVEPIPLGTLRDLAHGHLLLHGGSGLYLRPDLIEGLPVKVKRAEEEEALARIWRVPVGRADLPDPQDITMSSWRTLASGAMSLEEHVSRYLVEPLLISSVAGTGLTWQPQYPVGKKRVDFAVLDGEHVTCVVEVKLAMLTPGDGTWEDSKDFVQMRGYAKTLTCPGILMDANRICLFDTNGATPARIVDRAHATDKDLDCIRRHLAGMA